MSPIRANKCLDPIEEFPTEAAHPQPEIYSARPTRSVPKPKNCVEVTKLPPIFQPIFPYDYFNLIQSGKSGLNVDVIPNRLVRVLEHTVRVRR